MGFLKKFYIIPVILSLILLGCAQSLIKYGIPIDRAEFKMFGKTPEREFSVPYTFGDSLKLTWENEINGSFSNSSVTCYDSLIFINDLSGRIFAFHMKNGKEIGELKYKGAVYSSPVINNRNVIFAVCSNDEAKSHLIFYDFNNGKLVSDIELNGRVLTEILAAENGIIFNTDIGIVYKFDYHAKKVWEYKSKEYSHCSPAMNKHILVFGNDDGEIIALNATNGKLIYKKKIKTPFLSGVSISENTFFIGNNSGDIYGINLSDGKIIWTYSTGSGIVMTPAYNDNSVVVGNLGGYLYLLNKANGKLIWKTSTDGVLNATPLLSKNIIFTPDFNEKLHLINIKNGSIIKTLNFDGRTKLTPVYYFNLLFVGFDNGVLRAYEVID